MIQYSHYRTPTLTGTLALEVPDKEFLEKHLFIKHGTMTLMNAGLTIKSPKDEFVKKIGREAASKKMGLVGAKLHSVVLRGTTHVYEMRLNIKHNRKEYAVHIQITTVEESNEARLVHSTINV